MSVNKVILVGNLGRDPEVRTTSNGSKVVQLSIATSERWRDRATGEQREKTEWHRVVIFNERLADVADKLRRVRETGSTVFGAGSHQMELEPPMAEAEVAAFEGRRGITLPPTYRAFLTTIGRSGAGPYYGLQHPTGWADFADWIVDDVPADWLARASPLRPGPNPLPDYDEALNVGPCHAQLDQEIPKIFGSNSETVR